MHPAFEARGGRGGFRLAAWATLLCYAAGACFGAEPPSAERPVLLGDAKVGTQQVMSPEAQRYRLSAESPTDAVLQAAIVDIDARLRAKHGITAEQTAVGVLDLRTLRLAMIRPDAIDYAASVPKIAILLAWFKLRPEVKLDAETRRELALMIRKSDNALATKYSKELGLTAIQGVLAAEGFYDAAHGGGIWIGKHYGKSDERYVDPVGKHSHAATVRQLVRFYLRLEQGDLVSAEGSRTMREIFATPEIPHIEDKFVRGLAGRGLEIRRKAGWWETWAHDTAIVSGPGRHYILVALTHHAKGEEYLVELAAAVDDVLTGMKKG
ncbi:MAG: serine hydrolase [Verrucomicrobiota bacterium]